MERRGVIRLVGISLTGGCLSKTRATGPRNPPTAESDGPRTARQKTLRVTNLDVEEGRNGNLTLLATVVNESETAQTRTLRAKATIGDQSYVETREVDVVGGGERVVGITFDVAYDDFTGEGSVNVEFV